MFINLSKVFVALATVTAAAASAVPEKRQTNVTNSVTCEFLVKPDHAVDPSTTDLVGEFQFVFGRALSIATGSAIIPDNATTFAEGIEGLFEVNTTMTAPNDSKAQTLAIIAGWTGETLTGLVANWFVQADACHYDGSIN